MKAGSEYSFVVKANNNESEEFCSHERLSSFVTAHLVRLSNLSDPELNLGPGLDFEQAA